MWLEALYRATESTLPKELRPPSPSEFMKVSAGERLAHWLTAWSRAMAPRPVVLLIDEADVVSGPAMISLLRQLRSGFHLRPDSFPSSVALIGMRDLRDYLASARDGTSQNPGSPFNIKAASLTLRDFTRENVARLYRQHTRDTGQVFTEEAVSRAFYWTQGQPFMVNALARIATMELVPERADPITESHIDLAKEKLIYSRTTHLDSLGQRLREPRVARIVRAVLLGDELFEIRYDGDDFEYVKDLGLLRKGPSGAEASNPIYREVLARQLSTNVESVVGPPWWPWQKPGGGLDMEALVDAFITWWRQHAEMLVRHEDEPYKEAAAHLAFMGFLQRVVNGGGQVEREYAAGRGRVDLLVSWGGERHLVELKRIPPEGRTARQIREEGTRQLEGHLDRVGLSEGWLLIFDQRPKKTWRQRCWRKELVREGRQLHLRGA